MEGNQSFFRTIHHNWDLFLELSLTNKNKPQVSPCHRIIICVTHKEQFKKAGVFINSVVT